MIHEGLRRTYALELIDPPSSRLPYGKHLAGQQNDGFLRKLEPLWINDRRVEIWWAPFSYFTKNQLLSPHF